MTEAEFRQLALQGFNRVPVVVKLSGDLDTPLSVYLKLANRSGSYLLESVVGGERPARYSYIGLSASLQLRAIGRLMTVTRDAAVIETSQTGDPLAFVREFLARYRTAEIPGVPPFAGGLVGYFGYDMVRCIEPRLAAGWLKRDPIGCPDALLLLSEEVAVVDHLKHEIYLAVMADPGKPRAWTDAQTRLRELHGALALPLDAEQRADGRAGQGRTGTILSNFERNAFCTAVAQAKQLIHDGDAMQIVLSQRMTRPYGGSPLALYRALRVLNPSPYMFYFDFGEFHIVGSSPETMVRLEKGKVEVRPIAGTRGRGSTRSEDLALQQDLLDDPKERAEHIMLLDLGRNDVSRVAVPGTVRVTENMGVELYSHVMHIVSHVEGTLRQGLDAVDVLRATFPAGTVSGAPKIRAMEIIDEFEPEKRGVYAGAIGYLGFNGDMDLAIAIRTGVVKDGLLHVQAGAGIVADSVPENEWHETRSKAGAMLRAADVVDGGIQSDKTVPEAT